MTALAMSAPQQHCWGQVICFSASDSFCKSCPQSDKCALEVHRRLCQLSERIDVSTKLHSVQTFLDRKGVKTAVVKQELMGGLRPLIGAAKEKFDVEVSTKGLSKHAARIVVAVQKAGIDMRLDAQRGVNAFRSLRFRPAYMAEIQDLISRKKVFTSVDIKHAIGRAVNVSTATMNNTSSFVVSALEALGVITKIGASSYAVK